MDLRDLPLSCLIVCCLKKTIDSMTEFECEKVLPYDGEGSKTEQISEMFDHIARQYDKMNRLMSLGQDKVWRRKAIEALASYRPERVLDVATGTGDFAIAVTERLKPKRVLGVDISEEMMKVGAEKVEKLGLSDVVSFEKGDSLDLHLDDASFDAVTVAFGVRNFSSIEKGLSEISRVLVPGGTLAILEMTEPENGFLRLGYKIYTKCCLPIFARFFAKDLKAYDYLPASIKAFPKDDQMRGILKKCGFSSVDIRKFTMQTCSFYLARK